MLGLKLPTDPRWADLAGKTIEDVLVDHAFCEQKAASSCISMIVKYSDYDKVVAMLTPVVAEEWGHFERVIRELSKRGYQLGKPRKDEYVVQLNQCKKKGGSKEQQLLEDCMVNALIEARSCERFKMLWQKLDDENLKKFYYDLMVSEANHYVNFVDLARDYNPADVVNSRLEEYLEMEAEIIRNLDVRGDRVH